MEKLTYEKLVASIKEIGYEKVIKNLEAIQRHLMAIGIIDAAFDQMLNKVKAEQVEDFFSGWSDYQPL